MSGAAERGVERLNSGLFKHHQRGGGVGGGVRWPEEGAAVAGQQPGSWEEPGRDSDKRLGLTWSPGALWGVGEGQAQGAGTAPPPPGEGSCGYAGP